MLTPCDAELPDLTRLTYVWDGRLRLVDHTFHPTERSSRRSVNWDCSTAGETTFNFHSHSQWHRISSLSFRRPWKRGKDLSPIPLILATGYQSWAQVNFKTRSNSNFWPNPTKPLPDPTQLVIDKSHDKFCNK